MEASALKHAVRAPLLAGASPHLRLQGDERLIALVRRGHPGAFEALVKRYQPRLLAFCRHMLSSNEDAEDVLQEVFTAAFKAIAADERPIAARPWLYRIARNRCLNHLRRRVSEGQDSMDVFEREGGTSAADTVHRREEFRLILSDVGTLPEAQRTALLLREIDALTYEQVAEAMETTVSSVKSLLVRARMALAEAAEARLLSCAEVRLELSQVAEGLAKGSPQVRRHVKSCMRCRDFKRELRKTGIALGALYPVGPLVALKHALALKLGGGGAATAGASGASAGSGAGGILSAGAGSLAGKAVASIAAAALVTAGAVEVEKAGRGDRSGEPAGAAAGAPPSIESRPHKVAADHWTRGGERRGPAAAEESPVKAPQASAVEPAPVRAPKPSAPVERPAGPAEAVEPSSAPATEDPAASEAPPAASEGGTVTGSSDNPPESEIDDSGEPSVEPGAGGGEPAPEKL